MATAIPAAPDRDLVVDAADDSPNRESLARALDNLQATEARVQRNAERVYDEARSKLVGDLLPVLDNLDRTLRAAGPRAHDPVIEGVRMIRAQLEGVLLRYGVERVAAVGQIFQPQVHEAVAAVPAGASRLVGMVIDEVEPGYRFGGRLLRAAKVTVGVAGGLAHMPSPGRLR